MKRELKNLLLRMNGLGAVSRKQLVTQDSQNDLVNTGTLSHYIGQGFRNVPAPQEEEEKTLSELAEEKAKEDAANERTSSRGSEKSAVTTNTVKAERAQ